MMRALVWYCRLFGHRWEHPLIVRSYCARCGEWWLIETRDPRPYATREWLGTWTPGGERAP